jgi:hypothetical protein
MNRERLFILYRREDNRKAGVPRMNANRRGSEPTSGESQKTSRLSPVSSNINHQSSGSRAQSSEDAGGLLQGRMLSHLPARHTAKEVAAIRNAHDFRIPGKRERLHKRLD